MAASKLFYDAVLPRHNKKYHKDDFSFFKANGFFGCMKNNTICDWLCKNPPCSRAIFDLLLQFLNDNL